MKSLPILLFMFGCAIAAPFQRVAYDDAGDDTKQPHLVSGANWKFDNPGDATPETRTVAHGTPIEFSYSGLRPQAAYAAKLRFFSDKPRTMRIKAGATVLVELLTLETGKILEKSVEIPKNAYAKGSLDLIFECLSGPNAVVSEIEILSDDPTPLSSANSFDQPIPEELQRLSPQPLTPVPAEPSQIVSLDGDWLFNAEPGADFWTLPVAHTQTWKPIHVPGEWAMQDFTVKTNAYAAYHRTITIPPDWLRRRTILRFDAVHSACKLYVNGKAVGEHVGAFLPFEFDVTTFLQPGENRLDLAVCNESIADELAQGSRYACHPIGGILRKVQLISVPRVSPSVLDISTDLSPDLQEGSVSLTLLIANHSDAAASATVSARLVPVGILGIPLNASVAGPLKIGSVQIPSVAAGGSAPADFSIKLPKPQLWHAESPFLYRVEVEISVHGKPVETIEKNCGFRRIEVLDRRLYINGKIAKLKGVCRHSVHPTMGRALTPELIRKDAELFKAANCNFIRTSHYPAEEEFMDLCDQLGLFVMDEAPFCWVNLGQRSPASTTDFVNQTHLALLNRDRHHPSVIIWSLANESGWAPVFEKSAKLVKLSDSNRLVFFSHSEYYGVKGEGLLDLGTRHYPSWQALQNSTQYFRPMIYDEWAHLNAYNEREILTDPAIRDLWGEPVEQMWNDILKNRNSAGVAIWGGIDEKFFHQGKPVGYGPWGIIDGWRREKPEYWHVKKTFSPIHFLTSTLVSGGTRIAIPVENRFETVDFSHLRFQWSCGSDSGGIRSVIPPQSIGSLELELPKPPPANAELTLFVRNPQGQLVDRHVVTLNPVPAVETAKPATGNLECATSADAWLISTPNTRIIINRTTGLFSVKTSLGKSLLESAPHLMILPSDNSRVKVVDGIPIALEGHENDGSTLFSTPCTQWQADSVTLLDQSAKSVTFLVLGKYAEAEGKFTYTFTPSGCCIASFFIPKVSWNPRQVGIVFDLPARFQTLSWKRKGYWSCYPENHIGRLQGTAPACPQPLLPDLNGPRQQPAWDWNEDTLVFGSNDFRSTKHNIYFARLADPDRNAIRVNSDATQHTRCWQEKQSTRLLVASYSAQGAEHYFSSMSGRDRISYGSSFFDERSIANSVKLEFITP